MAFRGKGGGSVIANKVLKGERYKRRWESWGIDDVGVNFIVTQPKSSPPPHPPTMNNDRSIMAPLYISAGSYQ